MVRCGRDGADLTELLLGELSSERRGELLAHVEACEACRAEWAALRDSWRRLPKAGFAEVRPPHHLRRAVLALGRSAVPERRLAWAKLGERARRFAGPALVGIVGATLIVAVSEARGLLAIEGAWPTAALSLVLGGLLAALAGGALRPPSRAVRSLPVASAAAFTGYLALTVALPIPETVEFCRVRVLAAPELSMGSLCLIYVAVAVLYAGIPAGLAAYFWSDREWRWSGALAQATLFVLLALPVLGLHFGARDLILGLSALTGLGAGALAGGAVGGWARRRRPSGAVA